MYWKCRREGQESRSWMEIGRGEEERSMESEWVEGRRCAWESIGWGWNGGKEDNREESGGMMEEEGSWKWWEMEGEESENMSM